MTITVPSIVGKTIASREEGMQLVLQIAQYGEGKVSPNPMVGCVVVQNGTVVGAGYHPRVGEWHAERNALMDMKERSVSAEGATVFVNLEPCCHTGRTPPCTDILLEMKVARVIVGMLDPDQRMAGEGVALLRKAGVDVVVGILEEECRKLNHAYLLARTRKRPRFTLKTALTLDGYTADIFGQSKWITNAKSRQAGHLLRHTHDGILVGVGTVLADNPSLTTRFNVSADTNVEFGSPEDAIPIVLDSQMRTPADALIRTAGKAPIWFCERNWVHSQPRGRCLGVDAEGDGLSLEQIARKLVSEGVYSVLLEGGATIHRAFLEKGWVDRLEVFIAPKLIGAGKKALSMSPVSLSEVVGFDLLSVHHHDADVHLRYITSDWSTHV
jgi:diaminohydroxyphosphoribosylaminopyrimidine deaminase/5-amino-6-(5-phosphoribosylamino)uracil reductase